MNILDRLEQRLLLLLPLEPSRIVTQPETRLKTFNAIIDEALGKFFLIPQLAVMWGACVDFLAVTIEAGVYPYSICTNSKEKVYQRANNEPSFAPEVD